MTLASYIDQGIRNIKVRVDEFESSLWEEMEMKWQGKTVRWRGRTHTLDEGVSEFRGTVKRLHRTGASVEWQDGRSGAMRNAFVSYDDLTPVLEG